MTSKLNDDLIKALAEAGVDADAESRALRVLSEASVFVILRQPPGPGDAAPERNLVRWERKSDGRVMVPLFTDSSHIPGAVTPPLALVRVAMRVIVTTCGPNFYVINPLTGSPIELDEKRFATLQAYISKQGYDHETPSPKAPWAFRPPSDALYPIAYALASWFVEHGRVNEAYMYELARTGTAHPGMQIVLGLQEPRDVTLAKDLTKVAVEAGAPVEAFVVRFLPEEPSHKAGIEGLGLEPFYRRPD